MKNKIAVVTLCAMLFALCSSSEAQQTKKIPRIGVLFAATLSANSERIEAFRQGLRERGYVEGKDILIEPRFAEGNFDRLPALAADPVHLKVDVIVSATTPGTRSLKEATNAIPICHDQRYRSCWKQVRRQPCTTWRKYHWTVRPCSGVKRQTTGAVKRNRLQTLPRGCPWHT